MQITKKSVLAVVFALSLVFGLFVAMPLTASAVGHSNTTIDLSILADGDSGANWSYVAATNTITVTDNIDIIGSLTGATETLNIIDIPAGKTVTWNATYTGAVDSVGLIRLTGTNTSSFTMIGGAIMQNGTVSAIYTPTTDFTINITGGTVSANNSNTTVGGETVNVSGTGAVSNTSSSTSGHAIFGSAINVSGGTVSANGGRAIHYNGTGTITVSGGTVSTTSGYAIRNIVDGTVTVSGGEVSATTGTAISVNNSVALNGGTISATAGTAIDTTGTITVGGNVTVNGGTVNGNITNNGTLTYNVTGGAVSYNGVISGSGNLIKDGTSQLTLGGANTYNGNTTINAGQLRVLNGTLGGGTYTGNISIASGGSLRMSHSVNQILSGIISGGGSLEKGGTNTLTLSGTNTYTGGTTVEAGALAVAGGTQLGTGVITLDGGTLQTSGANNITQPITVGTNGGTINNGAAATALTGQISGSGTFTKIGAGALSLTNSSTWEFAGNIIIQNGTLSVNIGGSAAIVRTLSGNISGAGSLGKQGVGTLALGVNANTYTGNTNVDNGVLALNSNYTIPSGKTLSVASGATLTNNAVLTVNGTLSNSGTVNNDNGLIISDGGLFTGTTPLETLTFDANGGTFGVETSLTVAEPENELSPGSFAFNMGKLATYSKKPTRSGYTLAKWNTVPDGSGSDYSITGNAGFNPGDVYYAQWTRSSSGGGGGGSVPVKEIPAKTINDALKSDNPVITLKKGDSTILSEDSLKAIKDSGKTVEFVLENGLKVKIDPATISDNPKAFDLAVDITITNKATEINGTKVPANSIVIEPKTYGEFGFDMTITISAEQLAAAGLNGNNVKLFYIDDSGKVTELSKVKLNDDGSVSITISHASSYVLTEEELVVKPVEWENPFSDVKTSDWFYGDVEYAVTNGLFNGTSATTFEPQNPMTRAMFVTVLYRMQKAVPLIEYGNPFTDVPSGQWYTDAVLWAEANDIVSGTGGGRFSPDAEITRQDMAVILMRYIGFIKYEYVTTREYRFFADENDIADYAKSAIQDLNKLGIINGKGNDVIDPQGNATRAEVAAIIHRFVENAE